jgi:vacuolar-type H+-ATPase subunit H
LIKDAINQVLDIENKMRAVLVEARDMAKFIEASAEQEAESLLSQAHHEAEREAKEWIAEAKRQAEQTRQQVVAQAEAQSEQTRKVAEAGRARAAAFVVSRVVQAES